MRPSDAAVTEATGRDWDTWFELLDRVGAADWDHKAIVQHLADAHPELSSGWWRQSVTVEYEKARGLRVLGQTTDTGFQLGVRRTVDLPLERAWELLTGRTELWLGEGSVDVRKGQRYEVAGARGEWRVVTPHDRLRLTWQPDGWASAATLQLTLTPTTTGRTTIGVHLEKLPDAEARAAMREHWTEVLQRLLSVAAR